MNRTRSLLRDQALPLALVALFILALVAAVWFGGWPRGADSWGHLFKAEYLAGQMRESGPAALFQAAWMPSWYMGDPFLTYYPPLASLCLAPLIYLTGNPDIAYKLFVTAFFLFFSAGVFLYLNRTWGGWAACLGTLLATAAPYQMRTLFFEGNYPRALALLALPALALLTDLLLAPRRRRAVTLLLLALCWGWAIVAHPQQALLFAVGLGFYVVFRLVLDPAVPLFRIMYWAAALFFGALIASPWLLPAYSHAELSNVPFLPAEKIPLFSAPVSALLPSFEFGTGAILFGVGTIAIALLAIVARPDPRRASWFLAGVVAILFSLGPQGVFFSLLPFQNQLLPERFLNFSAFALPIAAAGIFPIGRRRRIIRTLLVIALATLDLFPGAGLVAGGPYPMDESTLASIASSPGGRTALMTYPEPTAREVYFAGRQADLINGWALENTPHNLALRRVLSAPEWSPDYLTALFSRWDVRTVVVAGGVEADPARAALPDAGFEPVYSSGRYQVWHSAGPASPVQVIPASGMLIVGDQLSPFLAAFPFAEETVTDDFLATQSGRLLEYSALGMYRFGSTSAQIQQVESYLRNYLEAGGTVVVDLSGMEDVFGRTLDFMGVHVYRMSFAGKIRLAWDPSAGDRPTEWMLPAGETVWTGAAYDGLDQVLAAASSEEAQSPVLGYRQIGRGRIWFVGANLLYYSQLNPNSGIATIIREAALAGTAVDTSLRMEPVPVADYAESADGIGFSYQLDQPRNVLVSHTYSPRWRAYVDGAPVPILTRDHLIRIALPAGFHRVDIRYDPFGTAWPYVGWFLGLAGLAGGLVLVVAERKWVRSEEPRRSLLEFFQMSETAPSGMTFSPCANCGFRLAEASPPTPATYPFQVSRCPICGAHMDDEGFVPGRTLDAEERMRLLTAWLRAHSYDPRTVYSSWGFDQNEFFQE